MDDLIQAIRRRASEANIKATASAIGITRQHLHKILAGKASPSIDIFAKLARELGFRLELKPEEPVEQVLAELASIGAPVAAEPGLAKRTSPQEIVAAALCRGRGDATVNAILPITMFFNWERIDWAAILAECDHRYLGYLLENLFAVAPSQAVWEVLARCRQWRPSQGLEPLDRSEEPSERRLENMHRRNNPIAARWGYLTLDTPETVAARFLKWSERAIARSGSPWAISRSILET
jgi:transcriptional regulator with XRE-family HTH domain